MVVAVVFAAEVTFWWYFLTRLPRRPLGLKWAPFRTDTASHTRAPAPLTLRKRREGKEGCGREGWERGKEGGRKLKKGGVGGGCGREEKEGREGR